MKRLKKVTEVAALLYEIELEQGSDLATAVQWCKQNVTGKWGTIIVNWRYDPENFDHVILSGAKLRSMRRWVKDRHLRFEKQEDVALFRLFQPQHR